MSHPTGSRPDLARGVWFGSGAGITLGVSASVTAAALAGSKATMPGYAWALMVLPGSMLLGLLFGLPVAFAMVWTAVSLQRRWALFSRLPSWMALGALFTAPVAWFVSFGLESLPIFGFFCAVGMVSAACAWLGANRAPATRSEGQISGENSSRTAS